VPVVEADDPGLLMAEAQLGDDWRDTDAA